MAHRLSRTARGRAIRNVRVGRRRGPSKFKAKTLPETLRPLGPQSKKTRTVPSTVRPSIPARFKAKTLPETVRGPSRFTSTLCPDGGVYNPNTGKCQAP